MTNYNKRLDDVLLHTGIGNCGNPFCDKPNIGVDEAKQAITSLIKELVAEAKPKEMDSFYEKPIVDEFEQNLLKALEEV